MDYGQTTFEIKGTNEETVLSYKQNPYRPINTGYLDQSSYSKIRYELKVTTLNDNDDYYFKISLKDGSGEYRDLGLEDVTIRLNTNGNTNKVIYAFELERDYEFMIEYLPERYVTNIKEYVIETIEELKKNEIGEKPETRYTVEDVVGQGEVSGVEGYGERQISVKVIPKDAGETNRYKTKNEVAIEIEEVLTEGKYKRDYEFFKLLLNGEEVEVIKEETTEEIEGKRKKRTTIRYEYTVEEMKEERTGETVEGKYMELEILYKKIYSVDLDIAIY